MDIFSIIGPIMIGPSSSHTAGACKIGNIAAVILGEKPVKAEITLFGSFAKSGEGHGTDKAIVAGILGFKSDDIRIKNSYDWARDAELDFIFFKKDKIGLHPNTAQIELIGKSGKKIAVTGESVGGGRAIIKSVNDFDTSFDGQNHTIIAVHTDKPGVIAFISKMFADEDVNIAKMSTQRSRRGGAAALIIEADQKPSESAIDRMYGHSLVEKIYVIPKL